MSTDVQELPAVVERESGTLRKVAERIGTVLSETYTVKGAKAKELRSLDAITAKFTPSQQKEMWEYFESKADKTAKWKVIRNWVVTGAGLALGTVLLTKPELIVGAVVKAGAIVSSWWKETTSALVSAGVGVTEAASHGTESVMNWIFDMKNPHSLTIHNTAVATQLSGVAKYSADKIASPFQQLAQKANIDVSTAWQRWFGGAEKSFHALSDVMRNGLRLPWFNVKFD